MKLNPILNKKPFGPISINDILGIGCAVFCAQAYDNHRTVDGWKRWVLWTLCWVAGMVVYNIVIILIKKYITKEKI